MNQGERKKEKGKKRLATLFVLLLAAPAAELAAQLRVEIPADRRIPARVVRTLAAPDGQAMHMPTDVAVDSRGRVFVADGVNQRVLRFDADGVFEDALTGVGDVALGNVIGLTVDARDHVWLADDTYRHILVVDREGALTERIPLPDPEDGRPFNPTDLAVTPDGERTYIVDNHNHRVVIRNNASGALVSLGRHGRALGQFQWPFMVALAPDGDAYITEAIGARVQRITPRDRWGGQVSRWGIELGQLYRPKGVVVDDRGRLYVSDSTLDVVQVFDDRSRLIGVLTNAGEPQEQPLRFQHPMGMSFGPNGRLYVVELTAHRVAVVAFEGDWLPADTQPDTQPVQGEVADD